MCELPQELTQLQPPISHPQRRLPASAGRAGSPPQQHFQACPRREELLPAYLTAKETGSELLVSALLPPQLQE